MSEKELDMVVREPAKETAFSVLKASSAQAPKAMVSLVAFFARAGDGAGAGALGGGGGV